MYVGSFYDCACPFEVALYYPDFTLLSFKSFTTCTRLLYDVTYDMRIFKTAMLDLFQFILRSSPLFNLFFLLANKM